MPVLIEALGSTHDPFHRTWTKARCTMIVQKFDILNLIILIH